MMVCIADSLYSVPMTYHDILPGRRRAELCRAYARHRFDGTLMAPRYVDVYKRLQGVESSPNISPYEQPPTDMRVSGGAIPHERPRSRFLEGFGSRGSEIAVAAPSLLRNDACRSRKRRGLQRQECVARDVIRTTI